MRILLTAALVCATGCMPALALCRGGVMCPVIVVGVPAGPGAPDGCGERENRRACEDIGFVIVKRLGPSKKRCRAPCGEREGPYGHFKLGRSRRCLSGTLALRCRLLLERCSARGASELTALGL